jgi:hypothetical protein
VAKTIEARERHAVTGLLRSYSSCKADNCQSNIYVNGTCKLKDLFDIRDWALKKVCWK